MVEVSVEVKGFEDFERNMKGFFAFADKKLRELLSVMLQEGEQYAINGVGHIDTGYTESTIVGYMGSKNKGVIVAGGNAIWIEFGTGVAKNSGKLHPEPVDSTIQIHSHGGYGKHRGASFTGWWYETDKLTFNQMKNVHYSLKGDSMGNVKMYAHTRGIEGNQFLFNTYKMLCDKYPEMAKEVFSKR